MRLALGITGLVAAALVAAVSNAFPRTLQHAGSAWTNDELVTLRSLALSSLGPLPADPSNRVADDSAAARLGHRLFFDTRLSGNGKVACATCHAPDHDFQDGRELGRGVGTAGRRTMPIAGTAYSPWQFWDGRADSQWGQALGPLESPVEHGGDRASLVHVMATVYADDYQKVFGHPARQDEMSRVYANMGKAIAAYERRISFAPARFDRYVEVELSGHVHTADDSFTPDERQGLRLFIGKANCVNCHNGALLTDNHFHNTGIAQSSSGAPNDSGRAVGARRAVAGEFNCLGKYSDAKPEDCQELRFAVTDGPELIRAFKTPTLRNVTARAPYMHAGQLATIRDVLAHYNRAAAAPAGKTELKPLRLSEKELRQIEAFLETLRGPLSAPAGFLAAPSP